MNKTKKIFLGFSALALVLGSFGLIANSAFAYKGNVTVKGPNYSVEREAAMEKAFETNDYNAWKTLMQNRGRVTQIINKDNFAKFSEVHELMEKGDIIGAQKIRQELGLGLKNGSGQGMKNNSGTGRVNCINR